ncbi:MAG: WS/DGAT/MGAT family O-acyltransferase [Myxococcota bacterium]
MAPSTPNQLSDGDAVFLSMETPTSGGHVGALLVLDPQDRPGFDLERLRDHVAARVALVPRFRWRLHPTPLDLDRPWWVEAADFDPRDHVVRTAVASPGDERQVAALASRLHARPLDRDRPLWEVWIIEGLAGGRVGLYMKTHHCLIDGTGGSGLAEVMADLTPDAPALPEVPEAYLEDAPSAPSALDMWTRAARNGAARPGRALGHAVRGLRSLWASRSDAVNAPGVERLFFNGALGPRRGFASASLDFSRVRDLGKHFDVKLNDVVLAVVGGAMLRWLRERGDAPTRPLVALCPVSTRREAQGLGNQITSMTVPLATDRSDPIERLRAIHENANRAKQGVSDGHFDWVAALAESFTPAAASLFVRAGSLSPEAAPLPGNFVVSNVRGTPMPLYVGGARVESMMPLSLLSVGQGLNVTAVSYCDRIDVGILVDADRVPDVAELACHFPAALEELELAAEGVVFAAA